MGALGVATGGTAVAAHTRSDLTATGELTRGQGKPAVVERTITRDAVTYLAETEEVEENGHTLGFRKWARLESEEIGADTVVSVVDRRVETDVTGVGSGVRYLLFGPVITVDHSVLRDRDGEVLSEPNVSLETVVSTAPRSLTVSVRLDGRAFTRTLPVGVGHSEVSQD